MVNNIIIMAGGAGKRLWPASVKKHPKQFLKVSGNKTLFLTTLERAFDLGITGLIYIITHEGHVELAEAECAHLDAEHQSRVVIVGEPIARNTAPALALAASRISLDGRLEETCLVMAADHIISPIAAFKASVEKASFEAMKGFIVPYGIVPQDAATGYGYIEAGNMAGEGFEVLSFREKPDIQTAKQYVSSGRHYWNAGMFTYRNDVFLSELSSCAPELRGLFTHPKEEWFEKVTRHGIRTYLPNEKLVKIYKKCPGISVDYAVMERSNKIRMVKSEFEWNDIGSWDVIADIAPSSDVPVYSYDSKGNFVYSDRPVALCGVENLLVVVANNRVLICRKGRSQLVKEAAEEDLD